MSYISTESIFSVESDQDFQKITLDVFHHQAVENVVYAEFIERLGKKKDLIKTIADIPFLPIEFFKNQKILCGNATPEIVFSSSGTTGQITSKHPVKDVSIYIQSFKTTFARFYGDIQDYTILALLPSYQEREGSSLIYMVDELIKDSNKPLSGYFLYNHEDLFSVLNSLKDQKSKVILIGVTYALLDFIEQYQINYPELIVMETGGMKGKRKEMIREELHQLLCNGFGVNAIHSEYGMTELLSQAYSKGFGKFECPPWMKIIVRDTNDPFSFLEPGKVGGINIIDLANIHSCSFLATQDLGKLDQNGSFEILGRFDNSDIRGCNLLVQ